MSSQSSDIFRVKKKQLIDSYKHKQEYYKQQISKLSQESRSINENIFSECQRIGITTKKLREIGKQYVKECVEALNSEQNKQIVDVKKLASYLKSEKELLKRMSTKNQINQASQDDIHSQLSRAKLQSTLRALKKKQLQDEIEYLETNVIVKENLIYNTALAPSITQSQEKQLNQKLQNSINELERVITLSIPCSKSLNESDKIRVLTEQTSRLKQCEALLVAQYEKLGKLIKYFEGVSSNVLENLPWPVYECSLESILSKKNEQSTEQISDQELTDILNFQLPQTKLVGRINHKFEDWEEEIQTLRKKYRKIEKLL